MLHAVLDALPQHPVVQAVVADFEWQSRRPCRPCCMALRNLVATSTIHKPCGCNVQVVGLQTAFACDDTIHRVCQMMMALSFLSANLKRDVFDELTALVTIGRLVNHLDYIRRN